MPVTETWVMWEFESDRELLHCCESIYALYLCSICEIFVCVHSSAS